MHAWPAWATAAVWVAFLGYWNFAAQAAAIRDGTVEKPRGVTVRFVRKAGPRPVAVVGGETPLSRTVHQLLMWAALLLTLLPWFWPFTYQVLPPRLDVQIAGLGVQLCFAGLYIWAKVCLGRHWSGAVRTTHDHQLVRSGPYRFIRHPMYTALLGMFLGSALVSGQVHGLLGLAVGVFAYVRKMSIEERTLNRHFGPEFEAYRRATWRLIPGVL